MVLQIKGRLNILVASTSNILGLTSNILGSFYTIYLYKLIGVEDTDGFFPRAGESHIGFTPINLYRGIVQNDPKIFEVRPQIFDVEAKMFKCPLICSTIPFSLAPLIFRQHPVHV
jgi:hypothetical protein